MTVVFVHIPKTAGTTIRSLLKAALPKSYDIDGPDDLRRFIELPQAQRDAFDLIAGHMPYGIHQYLTVKARYVTFLRDPVERVVSSYYHFRRVQEHPLHVKMQNISLSEFATSTLALSNDNRQTRQLGRIDIADALIPNSTLFWWFRIPHGEVGEEHLKQALDTLGNFDVVGFADATASSTIAALFSQLGLPAPLDVPHLNAGPERPPVAKMSPAELAVVRAANQIDALLIETVKINQLHNPPPARANQFTARTSQSVV